MRITALLLFALAGPALAAGTEVRSNINRLAYARAPELLVALTAVPASYSYRLRARSSGRGLHVLTVAAAAHLARCAAALRSTDPGSSMAKAERLAAKFIPAAERALHAEARRPGVLAALQSTALVAQMETFGAVEPAKPAELAARGQAIEAVGAEAPPALAARENAIEATDAEAPPEVEIAARNAPVAVAMADTQAPEELAPAAPAETMSRELPTLERVAAVTVAARASADDGASPQTSERAKPRRKPTSRAATKHRHVARRNPATVRQAEPPAVVVTYYDAYTAPDRGTIPRSAQKMYDANWQKSAFTYE